MMVWAAREHHRFEAAGKPFVYLVPSAAIFALDDASDAVLRAVSAGPRTREELSAVVGDPVELDATMAELARVRAIGELHGRRRFSRRSSRSRRPRSPRWSSTSPTSAT